MISYWMVISHVFVGSLGSGPLILLIFSVGLELIFSVILSLADPTTAMKTPYFQSGFSHDFKPLNCRCLSQDIQ